jgi:hypothetical protein
MTGNPFKAFNISMFLIFVFYRSRFFDPCQTFFEEYALYKRFLAHRYLIVYLYYQIMFGS